MSQYPIWRSLARFREKWPDLEKIDPILGSDVPIWRRSGEFSRNRPDEQKIGPMNGKSGR